MLIDITKWPSLVQRTVMISFYSVLSKAMIHEDTDYLRPLQFKITKITRRKCRMYENTYGIINQAYDSLDYRTKQDVMGHFLKTANKGNYEVWKSEQLIQQKNDLTAARELQQTKIIINSSGEVLLLRDTFENQICKVLPILVNEKILYFPISKDDCGMILKLTVCADKFPQATVLWISQESLSNAKLSKIFLQSKITFGYGSKKESEIRRLFVIAAAKSADCQALPQEHGWYKNEDETFAYAYPKDIVWKEVYENAKRYFK